MKLHKEGELKKPIARKIAYHLPCHLKAQNIGYKSKELMELVFSETKVEIIERCFGVDGTWGLKKEYFEMSLDIGRRLFSDIKNSDADIIASDCPLAQIQIKQETGRDGKN